MSVKETMELCLDLEVMPSKLKDEKVEKMNLQELQEREKADIWYRL